MKLQLSISLLASDRADSLERCLDSLRPLLMQIPSELIVVFTGTDERVREIAGRYTDKIIPFTWCNNFSAARNVGLWAAKGEWFLFIDDDEWFEDTSQICDFFLCGEYKQYGSACYIQRNYLERDGIHYSDFHAFRMTKLVPGISFKNTVHEELTPHVNPCKYFDDFVHHYGYIADQSRKGSSKTERNLTLLLKNIEERPNYVKNYLQIVQEYASAKIWDKAEEYCRKGREFCRRNEDPFYKLWLQVNLIAILYEKGDTEKTEQEALSILETEHPCELVCLEFYTTLIAIYARRNETEKVLQFGERFEKTLAYMDEKPELWAQQSYGMITEQRIKLPARLYQIRINCTEAALKMGNAGQAAYFIGLLPWDEEYWMQRYYSDFDFWNKEYNAEFQEILKAFPKDYPYVLLQRARTQIKEDNKKEALDILRQCMEKTESYYLRQQIIEEAVLHQIDPSGLAKQMDLHAWKQCAEKIMNNISVLGEENVESAAWKLRRDAFVHGLWLEMLYREKKLLCGYSFGPAFLEALTSYIQCILDFYKAQYRGEMFHMEQRSLLPADCRFALFVSEAMEKAEQGELPEAVRLFRTAIHDRPVMTGVIREAIRQMAANTKNPAQAAGEEFHMLAEQMKDVLRKMTAQKQYKEATPIILQLSPLLPDDLELLRIRQEVFRRTAE